MFLGIIQAQPHTAHRRKPVHLFLPGTLNFGKGESWPKLSTAELTSMAWISSPVALWLIHGTLVEDFSSCCSKSPKLQTHCLFLEEVSTAWSETECPPFAYNYLITTFVMLGLESFHLKSSSPGLRPNLSCSFHSCLQTGSHSFSFPLASPATWKASTHLHPEWWPPPISTHSCPQVCTPLLDHPSPTNVAQVPLCTTEICGTQDWHHFVI